MFVLPSSQLFSSAAFTVSWIPISYYLEPFLFVISHHMTGPSPFLLVIVSTTTVFVLSCSLLTCSTLCMPVMLLSTDLWQFCNLFLCCFVRLHVSQPHVKQSSMQVLKTFLLIAIPCSLDFMISFSAQYFFQPLDTVTYEGAYLEYYFLKIKNIVYQGVMCDTLLSYRYEATFLLPFDVFHFLHLPIIKHWQLKLCHDP